MNQREDRDGLRGGSVNSMRRQGDVRLGTEGEQREETGRWRRVSGESDKHTAAEGSVERKPTDSEAPAADPRWSDPEFVWKQKEKELFAGPGGVGDNGKRSGGGFRLGPFPGQRAIAIKLIVCGILYAAAWAVFHSSGRFAERVQTTVRQQLTEEFPFERVSAWYARTFSGAPAWLPDFTGGETRKVTAGTLTFVSPAAGRIAEPYEAGHPVIVVKTNKDAAVSAAADGLVTFAGERPDTGLTIVVRHPNGFETSYGRLKKSSAARGDWVKAGEPIGVAGDRPDGKAGQLAFLVMKDDVTLDPTEVVAFD